MLFAVYHYHCGCFAVVCGRLRLPVVVRSFGGCSAVACCCSWCVACFGDGLSPLSLSVADCGFGC